MKAKLSLTLDEDLVAFVDREPGATRSEKIESMLRRYRAVQEDSLLREELRAFGASDHDDDHDGWVRTMQEGMWNESAAETSGRSRSPRSRNRAQR